MLSPEAKLTVFAVPASIAVKIAPPIAAAVPEDVHAAPDVPLAFVAVTVTVYATPLLKPVTTIGEVLPVAVINPTVSPVAVEPVIADTVYAVIAEPPLSAGAVNATTAPPWLAVTAVTTGGSGSIEGVTVVYQLRPVPMQSSRLPSPNTVFDSQQQEPEPVSPPLSTLLRVLYVLTNPAALYPQWLCARTEKEYSTPFVRPVTTMGERTPVCVTPPGLAVTVYSTIDAPPVSAGDWKVTVAVVDAADSPVIRGGSGTLPGVVGLEIVLALPR